MVRDYDHLFKLVLIGDSGVGKSCILLRFADDSFTESYITTIGVDFRFRTINVDGKNVKLQIWDTAGQERFRTITSAYAFNSKHVWSFPRYYRGADGIIVVYDTTDRESFSHVDSWLSEVNKYANENTVKVLVGNKSDKTNDRLITTDEGKQKAEALGLSFIETSAKDSTHIEEAFTLIARQLVRIKEQMATLAANTQSANRSGPSMGVQLGAVRDAANLRMKECCSG